VYNWFRGGGGGGIVNAGYFTLMNSTVSGNSVFAAQSYYGGGGIMTWGAVTLTNSTVSGNTADGFLMDGGGGIWHGGGPITLTNCTVDGNTTIRDGGGIFSRDDLTLINSTVTRNTANYWGGGIANFGDTALNDSMVSGNAAATGGGIFNGYGYAVLSNSTVSNNTADYGGGGITSSLPWYDEGTVALTNTVVANNGTYNCDAGIDSLGYNLTDDTSCGFTATGDLVVADAMLGPLADNGGPTETHDLLPGSPAIDAGSPICPPPDTDQRGMARPQGVACDIGAVEYAPEPGRWLMLVAGVSFLTGLSRRRARRPHLG
jgi:hypothetical protein